MSYVLFARWFGLISVILSLGILFNLEDAREMAKRMVGVESGYIMGGVLPIIFGSLALIQHEGQVSDWRFVVITVGAFMLLIGILRVVFVRLWKKIIHRHIDSVPYLFSLFGLMLGVLLLYVGFVSNAVS